MGQRLVSNPTTGPFWYCPTLQPWPLPGADRRRYGWNIANVNDYNGASIVTDYRDPGRTILIADTLRNAPYLRYWTTVPSCPAGENITIASLGCMPNRHGGGLNFGFADAHVKWLSYTSAVGQTESRKLLWGRAGD